MADAISPQVLSQLIGSIYDCALDPTRWDETLPDIRDALDCYQLTLTLSDLRNDRLLMYKAAGLELDVQQLPKHVPEIHSSLTEALTSLPSLDDICGLATPYHCISRNVSAFSGVY